MLIPFLALTLSHMNSVRALGDLPPSKGDIDGVLALLCGLVSASVAAVALILNTAFNSALLSTGVHNDNLNLSYTSTWERKSHLKKIYFGWFRLNCYLFKSTKNVMFILSASIFS